MKRIQSIDTVRGGVMVIMALDHVREFIHVSAMAQSPTDLGTTTFLLFMTRWVTHLCAPAFVFISGISAFLYLQRNRDPKAGRFFLTRGIWLVILEFTLINFSLWFDIRFRLVILEVIGTIGFGFIVLSFLTRLSSRAIGIAGIVLIFTHDLLQFVSTPSNPVLSFLAQVLYRPGITPMGEGFTFLSSYPVLSWLGILLAGFGAGELFRQKEAKQKRLLLMGLLSLMLFLILRMANFYGDPSAWSVQKNSLFTVLSFVNVTKYPVSLHFSLLFVGFTLLLLWQAGRIEGRISRVLAVFGRVPLFYFIIHLYIIHILMFGIFFIQGFGWKDFAFGPFLNGRPAGEAGLGLVWIYAIWAALVISLWPVCKWFGNYKSSHPGNRFLKYL